MKEVGDSELDDVDVAANVDGDNQAVQRGAANAEAPPECSDPEALRAHVVCLVSSWFRRFCTSIGPSISAYGRQGFVCQLVFCPSSCKVTSIIYAHDLELAAAKLAGESPLRQGMDTATFAAAGISWPSLRFIRGVEGTQSIVVLGNCYLRG